MPLPTVNVTGQVVDPQGNPIANAIVTAKLSGADVYGADYVAAIEQSFTADVNGNFTLPLFPNVLGSLNTYYTVKMKSADGQTVYRTTICVVPNHAATLASLEGTGPATPSNTIQSIEYAMNIPFWDQTTRFLSLLKNFNTAVRNYIFPDVSGTVMVAAGVLAAGMVAIDANGVTTPRTLTGTANQVIVTNGDGAAGNPTFSLPQNIHAAATPTFAGMTLTGLTGYVKANGAGALTAAATIPSTDLATVTGTGAVVLQTSPTLITPILGAATATTINKITFTQPATGSTLTLADGKTLTVNNSLTLAGTDLTTMTFPTTSATIARTDAGQTFTGTQAFSGVIQASSAGTAVATALNSGTAGTGLYFPAGFAIAAAYTGTAVFNVGAASNGFRIANTYAVAWTPGAADGAAPDTGLSRVSAGVVALGNGTAGNASGTLQLATLTATNIGGHNLTGNITSTGNPSLNLGTGAITSGAITTSGNIGLNVALSSWGLGGYSALELVGAGNAILSSVSGELMAVGGAVYTSGAPSGWKYANSSYAPVRYAAFNGAHTFYSAAAGTAGNAVTWTTIATLNSSGTTFNGQVGVGAAPTVWTGSEIGIDFNNYGSVTSSPTDMVVAGNAYYNAGWKYRANGYAQRAYFAGNAIVLSIAPSNAGGAGAALTFSDVVTVSPSSLAVAGDISATTLKSQTLTARTSWTPTISIGGSTAGITYSTQSGVYSTVNGYTTATVIITLSSKGGLTGAVVLTNLPVSVAANSPCAILGNSMAGTVTTELAALAGASTTTISLYKFSGGGLSNLDGADLTNTSSIWITVTYAS